MNSIAVVILAAGQGKRIGKVYSGVPKVLLPVGGEPMIRRLVRAVQASGVASEIVVVVGPTVADQIRVALPSTVKLAIQDQPLGTGHALGSARSAVTGEHVMSLNGDHPFMTPETVRLLAEKHLATGATLTLATVKVPDFLDWRTFFYDWGRIVRDVSGRFLRITEMKDCTEEEKKITEVNSNSFCFATNWVWDHIDLLRTDNAQGELYLIDLLSMAVSEGQRVESVEISDPRTAIGVNTPEHLQLAEKLNNEIASVAPLPRNGNIK